MSKIPTPARRVVIKEENKIVQRKKVICTRRSGMFNKNLRKENVNPNNSKSAGTSGLAKAKPVLKNEMNIQTRQQVQIKQSITAIGVASTSKKLPAKSTQSTTTVNSQNVLNRKRPANETNDQTVPPKIIKPKQPPAKIPPYDFKARFNNLKEIHTNLKTVHEQTKRSLQDTKLQMQEVENSYADVLNKNERIEQELSNLKNEFELIKVECNNLRLTTQLMEEIQFKLHNTTTKLLESEDCRKKLHNQVQDLKGNIRVFCRCRPFNALEDNKQGVNISYLDEETIQLFKQENSKHEFTFDRVYPPNSQQEHVFEDLAELVQSCLDGYNICVFAYGQTGSGKTYTMIGESEPEKKGMILRSIDLIFNKIQDAKAYIDYEIQLSILEIYNENIRDLLSNRKLTHEIKYNDGKGVSVTNIQYFNISTPREFHSYLQVANKNRATATTNLNEHSSRSHAVIEILLKSRNKITDLEYSSKIYLVDLAGSENAKNSVRMDETKAINKSLSNLGNVMLALQNKDKYVPYRNSKLTYLLQSALGGNSKTLMFVNVSPLEEHFNETLNSLRFAGKVRKVTTKSKRCATVTNLN